MKESSVDKIFAKSQEEADKVREIIDKRFRTQENVSFKTERGKTPEELELIDFINTETDTMAKMFGGDGLRIGSKNIHIIGEDEFIAFIKENRVEDSKIPDAVWRSDMQAIIMKDAGNDLRKFINILTHEMYHAKAFHSLMSNLERKSIKWRKSGFLMGLRKRPKEAFFDLNEAVTEYLTHMNLEKWATKKESVPQIISETTDKFGEPNLYSPAYSKEQLSLMNILDEIQKKNASEFKDTDSVFSVFAEGYFTGKLLKLRKIVDKTFGAGSFVKFAKENPPKSKWAKDVEE